jgi:isopentenyldiphosphate isomerase
VPAEEILDLVDENDNVIGKDTRFNVHHTKSWHRGIHILVFNKKGEILLQIRAPARRQFPGKYDLSVSEHVLSGETYENAARRGLKEELGIAGVRPERIVYFRMNYGDPYDNMIGVLYKINFDGKSKRDEKETASVEFFPQEKLRKMIVEEPEKFACWTLEILRWHFGMESKLRDVFKICR